MNYIMREHSNQKRLQAKSQEHCYFWNVRVSCFKFDYYVAYKFKVSENKTKNIRMNIV